MQQQKISIRFGRIALCSGIAILIALLICMLCAALVEQNVMPLSFAGYAAQIGLCAGVLIGCVIAIRGRGQGTAIDIIIIGALSAAILLLMKLAVYPSADVNLLRPIVFIALGAFTAWTVSKPRRKKRRTSRKVNSSRK